MKLNLDHSKLSKFSELYRIHSEDSVNHFLHHFEQQFDGINFSGKKVLEIGCGKGFISLFIALFFKPKLVVSLDESLGEGADANVIDVLEENASQLGIGNIKVVRQDIMNYDQGDTYDLVISNNALHHVCEHGLLTYDGRARKKYVEIFKHIKSLLTGDGMLLLHEYSRCSIWRFVPNKRFSHIEWSLHPTKREWMAVLRQAGFKVASCTYCCPYKLRNIPLVAKNPLAMFFYYPNFFIRCVR